MFPKNTVVFAKIGAALLLGRVRMLPCEACIDNNMMGLIVVGDNQPDYFKLLMSLVRFDLIANPGAVPSLNEGQIASVTFPVPPPKEQRAIVAEIDRKISGIDDLVSETKRGIDLLQERRSALISAAVTGKIDVRDAVDETTEAA